MVSRVVIVGGGLAGASAAVQLRERDFDGSVTLLTNGQYQPYELPPLSKGVLLGETDEPDWVREPGFYRDLDIQLRTGTDVTELRTGERLVVDAGGTGYGYDAAVLATGSRPNTLPVPGVELRGIHTLRTLEDALNLRAELTERSRVVVVGAGWIGCEVASAARTRGAEVTVVEPNSAPLLGVLGESVAGVFTGLHEQHGVRFRFGTSAASFTGEDGKVSAVRLEDGSELPADTVVLAVGATPRGDLAAAAGLDTHGGAVAVDAELRSSDPNVYAVGDLAAHEHPSLGRIRVEHWANAKEQGSHVASVILGEAGAYTGIPYFFTDQYDLGCEFRGLADPSTDELAVYGSLADREFIAFWSRNKRVRAALNVNLWDYGERLDELVAGTNEVEQAELESGRVLG